ncbi:MAG: SMP-30/gluconolactonase/LRE family protein [Acidimicrobiia bacterium]|nr:SMP-30/gluconolactonase/LRE family protein [Acidimicrobiia bacterium]MYE67015.1 SMP-30/gluconolactonase/LRE family protein [Acidimicrobiia bacterium]MYJ12933.1 SMP-30/gluconolactonase/LRE family protein [Acidimicrobiia bacterium]
MAGSGVGARGAGGAALDLPYRVVAEGLAFPEGPVALADGSVLLVEVRGPRVTRVTPDGACETVAAWDSAATAGPNGAAIGPDGAAYVCNNGGFAWYDKNGVWLPSAPGTGAGQSPEYITGSIDRLDLDTGEVTVLYTACGGHRLCGPNDLVFDAAGGLWFSDHGKVRAHDQDRAGVFYATVDGSFACRAIFGLLGPNGVGLSPDGAVLYVSETPTGRLWAWDIIAAGAVDHRSKRCLANTLGHFDSLAVEADGTVVVAALRDGLCLVRPDGEISYVRVPGPLATNVCWGGEDLRTAYVTEAAAGLLLAYEWPRRGLRLAYHR